MVSDKPITTTEQEIPESSTKTEAETTASTTREAIIAIPAQWPDAVKETYDPIRMLGKGGFASVMLAKHKQTDQLAAIKITKAGSKMEKGYAHRELDILRELDHPNVMRVLDSWENSKTSCAMALSYAQGPTLQQLLDSHGALGLCFSRVVAAQLVSALVYLHSRAVIHRDIKPDNVIVTGASADQDAIYMDNPASEQNLQVLQNTWRVTLVDFGFARALGPEDLKQDKVAIKEGRISLHDMDGSIHNSNHNRSLRRRESSGIMDQSVSHKFGRQMSALGNRLYAAPEIINGVSNDPNISIHNSSSSGFDIMQTLSHHVSNYGMLADSFSLGNTLKYMLTGVPPNENVNEVIAFQNNPIMLLCNCLGRKLSNSQERPVRYRSMSELPTEVVRLIRGLTNPNVSKRTSIRAARRFFWIDECLEGHPPEMMPQTMHYLPCALVQSKVSEQSVSA